MFEVFCEVSDEVSGLDELERSVASPPVLFVAKLGCLSAVFSAIHTLAIDLLNLIDLASV